MGYEIRFDSEYGKGFVKSPGNPEGTTTLHCVARLFDGDEELRVWVIDGIPPDQTEGEAYRDAEADKLFQAFLEESSAPEPVTLDTTKWSNKLTKAAAE